MAFTISDDHAAQEEAWSTLPDWNRTAAGVRLTVKASYKLARFVGVDAYVEPGGGRGRGGGGPFRVLWLD